MSAQVVDLVDDQIIDLRDAPEPLVGLTVVDEARIDVELPRGAYHRFLKPSIDRTVAAALVLVLLPVLVTIAVLIRIRLGHGVLYRQERIGRGGRPFTVLKFRTMLPDRRGAAADFVGTDRRRNHKSVDDPRHTRLGQFLRKWSLDELPQLLNVVRGEMSLVGPRPELPHIVDLYEPWEHVRHVVRPGMTGYWQTKARASGPMQEFTHLDLEYVRKVSFTTDVRLLVATPFAALGAQKGT